MKPADWPRYMVAKRLARGVSYYWSPRPADRKAGCALEPEALGPDYGVARARAEDLNTALDAWRAGRGGEPMLTRVGTVDWWLHEYQTKTRAFKRLRPRTQAEYKRHLRIVTEFPLTNPTGSQKRIGDLPVRAMTPAAVDRLYERLVKGGVGKLRKDRVRQAAFEIDILKIAWRSVQRVHADLFPAGNPFEGLTREARGTRTKTPATTEEAYALADALLESGHPGLAAAALICFEWLQRPENVLAGSITWGDYRPGREVRITHWKTGAQVELELADDEGLLFPELEEFLLRIPKLGTPIVLRPDGKPYTRRHAHAVVAAARVTKDLPSYLTLSSCRHGGMTELGDAEVTEQEGMALSGHKTPASFRLYVKKTENQRRSAARKRRQWRDREEA